MKLKTTIYTLFLAEFHSYFGTCLDKVESYPTTHVLVHYPRFSLLKLHKK